MTYADFTLETAMDQFGLRVASKPSVFAVAAPITLSALLRDTLVESLPLAWSVDTDKARAELITSPVLMEVWRQFKGQISLFSGVDFTVDAETGLSGICDFLFCLSPLQLIVQAPIIAIVEAKNDNIKSGIGQCVAEMLAAQRFNAARDAALPSVYGAVTTGSLWKFLRLMDTTVTIDEAEYYITQPERIVGLLVSMIREAQAAFVP